VAMLRPGDRLQLLREPMNPYDENAIEVLGSNGQRLGYLPRGFARRLAPLMDAGEELEAMVIDSARKDPWAYPWVSIAIQSATPPR
jgi:hypothetical protein